MPDVKELAHMKEGEFSHKYDRNFNVVNGEFKEDHARKIAEKNVHSLAQT